MRYLALCLVPVLAACDPSPVLTNVVRAPVRVSCVTAVPPKPERLTPCKADETPTVCFQAYQVDVEVLQAAVDTLTDSLAACR